MRNRLRLARASEDIQAFAREKTDSLRALIYLEEIKDPVERASLIRSLLAQELATDDLMTYVRERKSGGNTMATLGAGMSKMGQQLAGRADGNAIASGEREEPEQSPREREREHIRSNRLKTILRMLREYQRRFARQDPPKSNERALMGQILASAQELAAL